MYKLLNKLFGWDYIQWRNSAAEGIARVHKDGNDVSWYWRYKNINVADTIKSKDQVIWLTCSPGKYLSNKDRALMCEEDRNYKQ